MLDQLEQTIFHFKKALRIIDQLYITRKESYPEYQILLAPFYYKMGDSLCTYIEINTDEMNQLKPLNLPEDPDDEDDQIEEVAEVEEASNAEEQKDPSLKGDNASMAAKSDEAEPIIEDV